MDADLLPWLISATGFAVAMSGSPGPNNTMVAASGANFGLRATLPHVAGVAIGFFVMLGAIALGMGDFVVRYPSVQEVLKWVGAAYLLWLAYRIGTARPMATPSNRPAADGSPGAEPAENGRRRGKPLTFLQAALFQWVNPKAWIVSVSAVATFTGSGGAFGMRTVLLPLIFLIVTVPLLILWTLTGVGAARLLRTPRQLQIFNYAMALLLVLSLIPQFLGE